MCIFWRMPLIYALQFRVCIQRFVERSCCSNYVADYPSTVVVTRKCSICYVGGKSQTLTATSRTNTSEKSRPSIKDSTNRVCVITPYRDVLNLRLSNCSHETSNSEIWLGSWALEEESKLETFPGRSFSSKQFEQSSMLLHFYNTVSDSGFQLDSVIIKDYGKAQTPWHVCRRAQLQK